MVNLFRQDSNNGYLSNGQIEKLTFKFKNKLLVTFAVVLEVVWMVIVGGWKMDMCGGEGWL